MCVYRKECRSLKGARVLQKALVPQGVQVMQRVPVPQGVRVPQERGYRRACMYHTGCCHCNYLDPDLDQVCAGCKSRKQRAQMPQRAWILQHARVPQSVGTSKSAGTAGSAGTTAKSASITKSASTAGRAGTAQVVMSCLQSPMYIQAVLSVILTFVARQHILKC